MTSGSVAELVGKLTSAAEAIDQASSLGVKTGAFRMKKTIEGSRDRVTGDGRLSGVGNAKLGVGYTLRDGPGGATALMKATGPWQLVENDTQSAGIVTGKVGRIKGRGAKRATRQRNLDIAFGVTGALGGVKPLTWAGAPGGGFFARVKDAPTKGQKPWKKGVDRGTPAVTSEIEKSTLNAFRRAFA